jgi:hypothetical protein
VIRRQQLSEEQIAELFDPPTEQRELVRHFTLSAADLAAIQRCRGADTKSTKPALRSSPARLAAPRCSMSAATSGSVGAR